MNFLERIDKGVAKKINEIIYFPRSNHRSFTPLNKANAVEACKYFKLQPGIFDCCRSYMDSDREDSVQLSFGVDERSAWCNPLVEIWNTGEVFLRDDTYEDFSEHKDYTAYWLESCNSGHYSIKSLERFVVFLMQAILLQEKVVKEFDEKHPDAYKDFRKNVKGYLTREQLEVRIPEILEKCTMYKETFVDKEDPIGDT